MQKTLTKTYQFVELLDNNIIEVQTPKPYIVHTEFMNDVDDCMAQFNQNVAFLYDCMKVLNINLEQAMEEDYTLNRETGMKLMEIARQKDDVSEKMKKLIVTTFW